MTQARWLDDFALFMAVKEAHGHAAWTAWETDIAHRDPAAIATWSTRCARDSRLHKLTQFLFFEQWQRVRDACHARSIQIMGDLPIFVAHDSADVWAPAGSLSSRCRRSADGARGCAAGLLQRRRSAVGKPSLPLGRASAVRIRLVDRALSLAADARRCRPHRSLPRIRGIVGSAGRSINGGERRMGQGAWRSALSTQCDLHSRLDHLPFVAENLGVITPDVEALRQRFGLPGMAILQFAFGTDPQAPDFKPHNYPRNLVVYTGTHDNDTTMGWWTGDVGHSTRSDADIADEREHATRYLGLDGSAEIHWEFIRAVMASVADTAIVPAQDLLGLGSEARMNRPGIASGNWRWRLRPGQLTLDTMRRLGVMAETYDRAQVREPKSQPTTRA